MGLLNSTTRLPAPHGGNREAQASWYRNFDLSYEKHSTNQAELLSDYSFQLNEIQFMEDLISPFWALKETRHIPLLHVAVSGCSPGLRSGGGEDYLKSSNLNA